MLSRLTVVDYAAAQDILRHVDLLRAQQGTSRRPTPRDWLDLYERQAAACHLALQRGEGYATREKCIVLAAILVEAAIRAVDPDPGSASRAPPA